MLKGPALVCFNFHTATARRYIRRKNWAVAVWKLKQTSAGPLSILYLLLLISSLKSSTPSLPSSRLYGRVYCPTSARRPYLMSLPSAVVAGGSRPIIYATSDAVSRLRFTIFGGILL